MLEAHLDHGAGPSVFDDILWSDSAVAAALVALATGAPLDRMVGRSGLDSARIQTLFDRGFLERSGDSVRTSFPVVLGEGSERYHGVVQATADSLLRLHGPDFEALLAELDAWGLRELGYHVLWSLVFDGQRAWVEMVDLGVVPPMDEVRSWVVYPAHPFKTGTNFYGPAGGADYFLAVSWRPGTVTIETAEATWEDVYASLLRDLTRVGEGPADPGGPARRPLATTARTPLSGLISTLTRTLHRTIRSTMEIDTLTPLFGGDERLAFAAAYHDVGWEVVGRLVETGAITVPPALDAETPGVLDGAASLVPVDTAFLRILGLR